MHCYEASFSVFPVPDFFIAAHRTNHVHLDLFSLSGYCDRTDNFDPSALVTFRTGWGVKGKGDQSITENLTGYTGSLVGGMRGEEEGRV